MKHDIEEYDYQDLDKKLDIVKTKIFLGKDSSFLGGLQSSLNSVWVFDEKTAYTNGRVIGWNPKFFLSLPIETRITVQTHELWHVARLDMIRRGSRDPIIWNIACDFEINNMLKKAGYSFAGTKPYLNLDYDKMIAEEIYDRLVALTKDQIDAITASGPWNGPQDPTDNLPSGGDLSEPESTMVEQTIVNSVVQAATAAKMGGAGDLPGNIENILKRFLQPKLPWDVILSSWFNELRGFDYSLKRPNRRYQDYYLASLMEDRDALDHVMVFNDQSGSVSDPEIIRYNSEMKYIFDTFRPEKFSIVLFDTRINEEYTLTENDEYEEIKIVGRGGTSLVCVRDHIIEKKPTCVIVFSDLECTPMEKLPFDIPIIWIGVNARDVTINEGKIIFIRE